jgi:enterochelin esterase-like enzyme
LSLLGWPLLVFAIVLALAAPAACVVLWERVRGTGAIPARLALILACQATATLALAAGVNDHYQFFASWSDLTGVSGSDAPIQQQNSGTLPNTKRLRSDFHEDRGHDFLDATVVGARSGIRSKVWVWLPPEYREHPQARFPVIELLPGFPGTPTTWFSVLHGPQRLEDAMKKGVAQPYILVAPTITVVPGRDTECVNVPRGPRVATWLSEDVRRLVTENFRALPGRGAWGTMGYSTGGYCAAKLPVQYPRLFRAGVSIAGYFSPATPALAKLPQENLPAVITQRHPPVDLLLATSRQDPGTSGAIDAMIRTARPPTLTYTYLVPRGGHNTGVWSAMLPKCFQWLTTKLTHAE